MGAHICQLTISILKMIENFAQVHERELFKKYELEIKCPKCKSEDILIGMDDNGYFWVCQCNKCGHKDKSRA